MRKLLLASAATVGLVGTAMAQTPTGSDGDVGHSIAAEHLPGRQQLAELGR